MMTPPKNSNTVQAKFNLTLIYGHGHTRRGKADQDAQQPSSFSLLFAIE